MTVSLCKWTYHSQCLTLLIHGNKSANEACVVWGYIKQGMYEIVKKASWSCRTKHRDCMNKPGDFFEERSYKYGTEVSLVQHVCGNKESLLTVSFNISLKTVTVKWLSSGDVELAFICISFAK